MKIVMILTFIMVTLGNFLFATDSVNVWRSDIINKRMLYKTENLKFVSEEKTADYVINIDPDSKYQQMDGFGASLTGASCYLLNSLTKELRQKTFEDIFGKENLNLNIIRQPIGASDFNRSAWTYDDTENNEDDFTLSKFNTGHEDENIRPVLEKAFEIRKGHLKIIGSPWSPPAWMKTGKNLFGLSGGSLRKECYDVYADYFVKYIKAYKAKGTSVYAITVQNEPLYAPEFYPGMLMSAEEEAGFIAILGKKFKDNGIDTKIICYDHNFDKGLEYATKILSNKEAYKYCAGTGFHPYCWPKTHEQMTLLHEKFPEKDVWLTEAGSGTWIGDDVAQFQDQVYHTIRTPRNWGKAVIFWNIALDQDAGPKLEGVDTDNTNRGILEIRSDKKDSVTKGIQYYSMAHSSRFVNPGAYRIASNTFNWEVEDVAYKNPDKTTVVVLLNKLDKEVSVRIGYLKNYLYLTIKPKEAVTLKW